jgi:phage terminase large subunit GpA-like protein
MIDLSDTSDLEAQYRRSLEPPPDLPWWQWASAGGVMLLPPVPTPRYGPYDIEWTPHLVGIAMALSDPNVWCVTVQKPAQEGCTTFAVVYFLWKARFDPGNILYVTANVDLARDKAEETFKPMIEGSPEIAAELVDDRHNLNALRFQFKKCTWYNAGGNSAKGLASKPVPYIILDEENKYDQDTEEGDQSELAIERTNTFHNRKVIRPCTPRTKKSRGYRAFMQGDQRRFFVPCPHCGHRQRFEHKQVVWPADAQPMKAAEEARYKCANESCGVLWTDQDRVAAIHAARHLPDFGWIPTAEPMEKGITSFQFSKLANPHVTLSAYVSKWLRSQQSKELLRGFIQNWMGECWESEAIEVTPAALAACRAGYSLANPTPERVSEIAEWTHREGKEVESQVFIHADVQKDGM